MPVQETASRITRWRSSGYGRYVIARSVRSHPRCWRALPPPLLLLLLLLLLS